MTRVGIREQRALNQAMLYAKNIPPQVRMKPARLLRSLRSALRMTQADLARRCGLPQAHIARIEAGKIDIGLGTFCRLMNAMFCDVLILPLARVRPSYAFARHGYSWKGSLTRNI